MSELVGARALGWAGGVVTLLGIIFFFVLAVNRGWVSPELRVILGAATSAALYGAALYVRRRYGNMVAALAAAGAAIGGGYATLVAATALYHFLSEPQALLVAAGIAAVGVVTALAWDVRLTAPLGLVGAMLAPPLVQGETTLLGVGFVAVVPALTELLDGKTWGVDHQGAALLLAGAGYGALGALVFREEGRRDLSTLLWAVALVLAGGGLATDLLDGQWLVLSWAVVAALLAWLVAHTAEERFSVASLAYVATALGYTFVLEAPPSDLFLTNPHPASGVPSLAAVTLAAFVFAWYLRRGGWRRNAFWVAGGLALYGASLSILGFFQVLAADEGESVAAAFQRGHTAVSSFWGVVGLVLLSLGLAKRWTAFRPAGLALFAVALAKIFLYDLSNLSSMARALSFLGVGTVLLLAAFLYQRLTEQREDAAPERATRG